MTFMVTLGLLYLSIIGFVIYRYFAANGQDLVAKWRERYQKALSRTMRTIRLRSPQED